MLDGLARSALDPATGSSMGVLPSVPAPRTAARDDLRRVTAENHQRLHGLPEFVALEHGTLTLEAYRRLLGRLFGLHEVLEARIAAHDDHPDLSWRRSPPWSRRPALLRQDLTTLGLSDAEIAELPRSNAQVPNLDDAEAALAAAWVVEGSTLGGKVMSRWLMSGLGIGESNGGSFFADRPGAQLRWRACCAAVEARGADTERREKMVVSALATFAATAAWLEAP
jgi:heme oxygenase